MTKTTPQQRSKKGGPRRDRMKATTKGVGGYSVSGRLRHAELLASRAVQRDRIRWWVGKKWSPSRIHATLKRDCGHHVYSYKTVVYHCARLARKAAGGQKDLRGRPRREIVDEKILEKHATNPDLSARKMAMEIEEPRETVRRHLIDMGARHCSWQRQPHELTPGQKVSGHPFETTARIPQEEVAASHHRR